MSNGEAAKPAAKGMAGLVVADSSVGFVDGASGILEYRGYDIGVLAANSTYEQVAYLLWNGRLPTANELADMKRQSRGDLPFHAAGGDRRAAQPAQERRCNGCHAQRSVPAGALRPGIRGNTRHRTPAQGLPPAGSTRGGGGRGRAHPSWRRAGETGGTDLVSRGQLPVGMLTGPEKEKGILPV